MWQPINREELYEQVWSVPIWKLCEQYGLSDNGLRKVCRRLNVPVPPRGYWAKVESGHRVRKVALPKEAKRTVTEVWREPKQEKTPADDADAVWLKQRGAFETDPANLIEVVPKPRRWHAAMAPLRESLEEEAQKIEAARKRPSSTRSGRSGASSVSRGRIAWRGSGTGGRGSSCRRRIGRAWCGCRWLSSGAGSRS